MKKTDQEKFAEKVAEALPYLFRMMIERRDRLHQAGSPQELERQVVILMALAYSFGIGIKVTNADDWN